MLPDASANRTWPTVLLWLLAFVPVNVGLSLGIGYMLRERNPSAEAPAGANKQPEEKTPSGQPMTSLAVLPIRSHMSVADSFSGKMREVHADLPAVLERTTGARVIAAEARDGQTPWRIGQDLKVDAVLSMDLVIDVANITGVEARLIRVDNGLPVWNAVIPVKDGGLTHLPGELVKALKPHLKAAVRNTKPADPEKPPPSNVPAELRTSVLQALEKTVFADTFAVVPDWTKWDAENGRITWLLEAKRDFPDLFISIFRSVRLKQRLSYRDADGVSVFAETLDKVLTFEPSYTTGLNKGNRVRCSYQFPLAAPLEKVKSVVVEEGK
jgi:hypothetical protein